MPKLELIQTGWIGVNVIKKTLHIDLFSADPENKVVFKLMLDRKKAEPLFCGLPEPCDLFFVDNEAEPLLEEGTLTAIEQETTLHCTIHHGNKALITFALLKGQPLAYFENAVQTSYSRPD